MKQKRFKKILAGVLAAVTAISIMPDLNTPLMAEAGGLATKSMNLDTSCLAPTDDKWDSSDHKVYFGQYDSNPTAFRVLKAGGSTLMLDCDTVLLKKEYDKDSSANTGQTSGKPNEWSGSDLESWLNGGDYYKSTSVFADVEKNAIAETSLSAESTPYSAGYGNYIDYKATDYVYLLSAREANELYADNAARRKTGGTWWWLRSTYAYAITPASWSPPALSTTTL